MKMGREDFFGRMFFLGRGGVPGLKKEGDRTKCRRLVCPHHEIIRDQMGDTSPNGFINKRK